MPRSFVALVAALLVGFAAMAPPAAQAQQAPPRTPYSFPDYWRTNFISSCVGGSATQEICGCILRGFEFSWPYWVAQEFDSLSAVPEAQRTPQQNELNAAASRIIIGCARNPAIY